MKKGNAVSDIFLDTIKSKLQQAVLQKDHPFRHFTLATTGINHSPRLRIVVLRRFDEHFNLSIFTDRRSKKITHLRENPKACLLFYDPAESMQVKIDAYGFLEEDERNVAGLWKELEKRSRKDYTSTLEPGTKINAPDDIEYLKDQNYFTIIHFQPYKIEYLKLGEPHHTRVLYNKEDKNWVGNFMIP